MKAAKAVILKLSPNARPARAWLRLLCVVPGLAAACSGGGGDDVPDNTGGFIGASGRSAGGAAGDAGTAGADEAPGGDSGSSGSIAGSGGRAGGSAGGSAGRAGAGASGATGAAGSVSFAGATSTLPSCNGSQLTCGPNTENCCASLPIPGGQFYRSYDGVSPDYQSQSYAASVTAFNLDKFEVSVSRFRQFVAAVVGSWRPEPASGRRTDLNLGKGRLNVAPDGGNEPGWSPDWNAQLPSTVAAWNTQLGCGKRSTWTAALGDNELLPITCVDWYEALAFCIWDEATLPSEAEWNEAASGGAEQRVYPWSSPALSQTIDCAHANYLGASGSDFCVAPGTGAANAVGSESPAGDGRWGHADLAGNAYEWVLDSYADYTPQCPDCAYIADVPNHVIRGGSFTNDQSAQLSSKRAANGTEARSVSLGMRCARTF